MTMRRSERGTVILVTGGHGSGKTAMALKLAEAYSQKLYIATAEPIDDEMRRKIAAHRAERDESYTTREVPLQLPEALREPTGADLVIVDCLTVWLGNLLHYESDAERYMEELCAALPIQGADIILITNESGLALIPSDPLSRKYLRLLAGMNKRLAALADSVYMMVSGIPMKIKEVK